VQLLIFLLQLPYPLLHGGERFANARLTVLFRTVLRQAPPDRRLADAHGLADVLDALTLLLDHAHYFKFRLVSNTLRFLVVMFNSSGGIFSTYRGVRAN